MKFSPYTTRQQRECLPPLLDYLLQTPPDEPHFWQEWFIERVFGGQNNLLFHGQHENANVAVKITRVDERNRAVREFNTLLALQQADLNIAPLPLALDAGNGNGRQVVVQSWLDGDVRHTPPQSDEEWALFLEHILLTHTVLPEATAVTLPPATLNAAHPDQFLDYVKSYLNKHQLQGQEPLAGLVAKLETRQYPQWPVVQRTLIHCDTNPRNFVRRPSGWLSVDWENSGWGDPALEIADVLAHAGMMSVPLARWPAFVAAYAARCGDDTAVSRIWAYYPLIVTLWVAIFSKGMYDLAHQVPHDRLAPRPFDWAKTLPIKYNHYLNLAYSVIN